MTDSNLIYWAVVHESTDRIDYIELTQLSKTRWSAVLGEKEIKFKTTDTEFFPVLTTALAALAVS